MAAPEKPKAKDVADEAGISPPYASMILSDSDDPAKSRTPPRSLAILIYRKFRWRHPSIVALTEHQMRVIEEVDPWVPPKQREAA
jgi:hypothetical protein